MADTRNIAPNIGDCPNVPLLAELAIYNGDSYDSISKKTGIPDSTLSDWIKEYKNELITPQSDPFRAEERVRQALQCEVMGIDVAAFSTEEGFKPCLSLENNLGGITIDFFQMEDDYNAGTVTERLKILTEGGFRPKLITTDLDRKLVGPVEELWKLSLAQGPTLLQDDLWHLNDRQTKIYKMPVLRKVRGISEKRRRRFIMVRRAIIKTAIATTETHQDKMFVELMRVGDLVRNDKRAVTAIENHLGNRRYYHPQVVIANHVGVPDCRKLMYSGSVEASQGAKKDKSKSRRNFPKEWASAYEYIRRTVNQRKDSARTIDVPHSPMTEQPLRVIYSVPISFLLLGYWLDLHDLLGTGIPEDVLVGAAESFVKKYDGILIDRRYLFSDAFLKNMKKLILKRKRRQITDLFREHYLSDELGFKVLERLHFRTTEAKMTIFNFKTVIIQQDAPAEPVIGKAKESDMTKKRKKKQIINYDRCPIIQSLAAASISAMTMAGSTEELGESESSKRLSDSVLLPSPYAAICADFSIIPWARRCTSCETYESRFDEKKNRSLWYTHDHKRTGRRRKTGVESYCHRCFYRDTMRARNHIDPSNYRV